MTNSDAFEQADGRLPISWSAAHIAKLTDASLSPPGGAIASNSVLAIVSLMAVAGDFDSAQAAARTEMQRRETAGPIDPFTSSDIFAMTFIAQDFAAAASFLARNFGLQSELTIDVVSKGPGHSRVLWEICLPNRMQLTFDATVCTNDHTRGYLLQFYWLFPLLAAYEKNWQGERGSVVINYYDIGLSPGLSFCDNRSDRFLIPDPIFVSTRGYEHFRRYISEHDVDWELRQPIAFWRGTTTGHPTDSAIGWPSMPRIALCELSSAANPLDERTLSIMLHALSLSPASVSPSGARRRLGAAILLSSPSRGPIWSGSMLEGHVDFLLRSCLTGWARGMDDPEAAVVMPIAGQSCLPSFAAWVGGDPSARLDLQYHQLSLS